MGFEPCNKGQLFAISEDSYPAGFEWTPIFTCYFMLLAESMRWLLSPPETFRQLVDYVGYRRKRTK